MKLDKLVPIALATLTINCSDTAAKDLSLPYYTIDSDQVELSPGQPNDSVAERAASIFLKAKSGEEFHCTDYTRHPWIGELLHVSVHSVTDTMRQQVKFIVNCKPAVNGSNKNEGDAEVHLNAQGEVIGELAG